jgi:hypothetical protein
MYVHAMTTRRFSLIECAFREKQGALPPFLQGKTIHPSGSMEMR